MSKQQRNTRNASFVKAILVLILATLSYCLIQIAMQWIHASNSPSLSNLHRDESVQILYATSGCNHSQVWSIQIRKIDDNFFASMQLKYKNGQMTDNEPIYQFQTPQSMVTDWDRYLFQLRSSWMSRGLSTEQRRLILEWKQGRKTFFQERLEDTCPPMNDRNFEILRYLLEERSFSSLSNENASEEER